MKITRTENEKKANYPRLVRNLTDTSVILLTSINTGVVIYASSCNYKIGEYRTDWQERNLYYYHGSITLLNYYIDRGLIPQTEFTRQIAVTVYDAKTFIGRIESQIEILEMVGKKTEAKHWRELSKQANLLFGLEDTIAQKMGKAFHGKGVENGEV